MPRRRSLPAVPTASRIGISITCGPSVTRRVTVAARRPRGRVIAIVRSAAVPPMWTPTPWLDAEPVTFTPAASASSISSRNVPLVWLRPQRPVRAIVTCGAAFARLPGTLPGAGLPSSTGVTSTVTFAADVSPLYVSS